MLYSFDMSNVKFGGDVYELYCADVEPVIDIIFIHGLMGGLFKTWRQKDDAAVPAGERTYCWPKVCSLLRCDYFYELNKFL